MIEYRYHQGGTRKVKIVQVLFGRIILFSISIISFNFFNDIIGTVLDFSTVFIVALIIPLVFIKVTPSRNYPRSSYSFDLWLRFHQRHLHSF